MTVLIIVSLSLHQIYSCVRKTSSTTATARVSTFINSHHVITKNKGRLKRCQYVTQGLLNRFQAKSRRKRLGNETFRSPPTLLTCRLCYWLIITDSKL